MSFLKTVWIPLKDTRVRARDVVLFLLGASFSFLELIVLGSVSDSFFLYLCILVNAGLQVLHVNGVPFG